jgi:hypothetical protein
MKKSPIHAPKKQEPVRPGGMKPSSPVARAVRGKTKK